jgi:hypothetical protein
MSSHNESPRRSPRRHSSSSPSFSTRQNPGAEKPRLSPTALSAKRRVEEDNSSVLSPRQKDSNVEIVSSPKRRKYSTPDRELPLSIISDQFAEERRAWKRYKGECLRRLQNNYVPDVSRLHNSFPHLYVYEDFNGM